MHIVKRGVRRLAGATLALALVSGAASASELTGSIAAADPASNGPAKRTLAASAALHAAAAEPARALQSAPTTPAAEAASRPFFKTPRGVATAVLMVAGLGWVFYSKSHDRVKSPANN